MDIVPMSIEHAAAAARLHRQGIPEGFIASLGEPFLRALYEAIVTSSRAFGFVALDRGEVCGFVTCAETVRGVYSSVLKRRFFRLAWSVLPRMARPGNLRNLWETFRYPARAEAGLPEAELLSIAVAESARGGGVGRRLFERCVEEFHRRGVPAFKIMVGEGLPANGFYQRLGCRAAGLYRHHGRMLCAYVRQTAPTSLTVEGQSP